MEDRYRFRTTRKYGGTERGRQESRKSRQEGEESDT